MAAPLCFVKKKNKNNNKIIKIEGFSLTAVHGSLEQQQVSPIKPDILFQMSELLGQIFADLLYQC